MLVPLMMFLLLIGCGGEDNSATDKIIGNNDLKPIEIHYSSINAIGLMRRCTASHLGSGYVLTSGHCLGRTFTKSIQINAKCNSHSFDIKWGVTERTPRGVLTSQCQSIVMREYNRLRDYAVIRVLPYPRAALSIDSTVTPWPNRVRIVSYPKGRFLETSDFCSIALYWGRLNYTCDTEAGSSGAPILNSRNQIIGVHNFESFDRNGGTLLRDTELSKVLQGNSLIVPQKFSL